MQNRFGPLQSPVNTSVGGANGTSIFPETTSCEMLVRASSASLFAFAYEAHHHIFRQRQVLLFQSLLTSPCLAWLPVCDSPGIQKVVLLSFFQSRDSTS